MPRTDVLASQQPPPSFASSPLAPSRLDGVDALAIAVLGTAEVPVLGPGAAELIDDSGVDLLAHLAVHDATGAVGEVTTCPLPAAAGGASRVHLVGVGAATPKEVRRAGGALARRVKGIARLASSVSAVGDADTQTAFVEGLTLGSFGFTLAAEPDPAPVSEVTLACTEPDSMDLDRAVVLGRAGWRSRQLTCVPSNIKNPPWLADTVAQSASAVGLRATVLEEEALAEQGFGGVLAVGRASATPPRLVRLDYVPRRRGDRGRHVVLVGKGITFDSGGLTIKPGEGMRNMKRDMTGAAVVAAVLTALPELDLPVRVTGLLPLAENSVGGASMRPGDVITHVGGRTTEVTNTDAEGRLVLGDALAYAAAELDPDVLIDVATLTGGAKVALGMGTGALFATDDDLAAALDRAGAEAGEPLWRLPLAGAQYAAKLASAIADADNGPGGPQAITAALFLEPFTGGTRWAHLDIASAGDSESDTDEWTAGPTGFGPRLLLRWLEAFAGSGS